MPAWVQDTSEFLTSMVEQFRVASWPERIECLIWIPALVGMAILGGLVGIAWVIWHRAKPWLYEEPEGGR